MSRNLAEQLDLPDDLGLDVEDEISRGASSIIYKAHAGKKNGMVCALKIQRQDSRQSGDLRVRFRREAASLTRMRHPAFVEILDVGETKDGSYLLMEYVDGRALSAVIADGAIDESRTIDIAKTLADALAEAHRVGVIHRDLKPANVLIAKDNQVKLIDFGFATQAASAANGGQIVGTFLYSSPEQLGLLERPVDSRSDLYSLGILLFECLIGRPPFAADDVGQLARKHLAEVPPKLNDLNKQISTALTLIVAKLLAKDPDDRYQTASGLLADLQQIDEFSKRIAANEEVLLGAKDDSLQSFYEVPIWGRDLELAKFSQALSDAHRGKGSLVLVEGEPGVGKSRLVREAVRLAMKMNSKALYLAGKASMGDSLPLGPIRQAIDGHLKEIKRLPEIQRQQAEMKIVEFCGEFAPVLQRLSPEMGRILKPHTETDRAFSKDIFQTAVVEFLLRMSAHYGFAVLLIDDVQWLDEATSEILRRLATVIGSHPILILGTSRNDSASAANLKEFVQVMETTRSLRERITLGPLSEAAIRDLVCHHLRAAELNPALISKLHQASNGNPFAAGEYVRAMLDAGQLRPRWGRWDVAFGGIEELALSTDVIQLVVSRVQDLSKEAKEILRVAALVGNRFSPPLLASLAMFKAEVVNQAIAEAVHAHLIERENESDYQFTHDRVREALLVDLGETEGRKLNQKVAELLDQRWTQEGASGIEDTTLYQLARFYSRGEVGKNPKRVFEINYWAGQRAVQGYANEEAYGFLDFSYKIAGQFQIDMDATFDKTMGRICVLTFRLKDGIRFLNYAYAKTHDSIDKAMTRGEIARANMTGWEIEGAWSEVNSALAELGRPLPRSTIRLAVSTIFYWLAFETMRFFRTGWGVNASEKRHRTAYVSLLNLASEIAAFKHPLLLAVTMVRSVFFGERLEASKEFVRGYATYAVFLEVMQMTGQAKAYYRKALEVAEQLGDRLALAECTYMRGLAFFSSGKPAEALEICEYCASKYGQWMDPRQYFDLLWTMGWSHFIRGKTAEALRVYEELILRARNMKNSSAVFDHYSPANYGACLVMHGKAGDGMEYLNKLLAKLRDVPPNVPLGGDVYTSITISCAELEDFGAGFKEAVAGYRSLAPNPTFSFAGQKMAYIAAAYAYLKQYLEEKAKLNAKAANGPEQTEARLKDLRHAIKELKQATSASPFFHPHILNLKGALAADNRAFKKAERHLKEAYDLAAANGDQMALYENARIWARVLKWMAKPQASADKALYASRIAFENGWVHRVKSISGEFGVRVHDDSSVDAKSASAGSNSARVMDAGDFLRFKGQLESLLEVSLASIQSLDPQKQCVFILDQLVKVMGGERAYVFTWDVKNSQLRYAGGRDNLGNTLAEPKGYSSTVVDKVCAGKEPIVVTGTDEGQVLGSESAVVHNLRSIIAAPLTLRNEFKGVVYIDSRLAKGLFNKEDVGILAAIGNYIAIAFETSKLALLEAERREMARDLELSATVQQFFLPKEHDGGSDRVKFCAFFRPATQCSGDWWWYEMAEDKQIKFFLGDVTGHGAAPAMITASVASGFKMLKEGAHADLRGKINVIDRHLCEFAESHYWMTACAAEIDPIGLKLKYYSMGHPGAFFMRAGGPVSTLKLGGTPLGSGRSDIAEETIDLSPNDRIFFYTDGLLEMSTSGGGTFGERRLKKLFHDTRALSLEEARAHIIAALDKARASEPQDDDFTFVIFEVK